jgi:hypothetical protein
MLDVDALLFLLLNVAIPFARCHYYSSCSTLLLYCFSCSMLVFHDFSCLTLLLLLLLDVVVTPLAQSYYYFLLDTTTPLAQCCCSLFVQVSLFCTCDVVVPCSFVNVATFAPLVLDWYFPL